MFSRRLALFMAGLSLFIAVPAAADMVILKSGEMFHTRRAWQADGNVHYYRNGQLVRVPETMVERVIHEDIPTHGSTATDDHARVPQPSVPHGDPPAVPMPDSPVDGDAGFLGLKWGLPLFAFKDLTLVETDPAYGGVAQYVDKTRPRRFHRAPVDGIYYGFWQGRLYTILVEVSNYLDYTALKTEVLRRYGRGQQPVPGVEGFNWQDSITDRRLAYDDASHTGYLWMRSRAVHALVNRRYPSE